MSQSVLCSEVLCTLHIACFSDTIDPEAITKDPYDGQVRLVGEDSSVSSGLAEIYLNNEWGTVCYEGMTKSAADSFCRQVGYTNSLSYMPVNR